MRRSIHHLRRALFGAAVLGSLGFGASQALASQPKPSAAAVCGQAQCILECVRRGYDYGHCLPQGGCACYYIMP